MMRPVALPTIINTWKISEQLNKNAIDDDDDSIRE